MLATKYRLTGDADIKRVLRRGKLFRLSFADVKIWFSGSRFRGTVICGKKVSKLAVERNRIKRRMRALLELIINTNPNNKMEIVIIARGKVLTADFSDLKKEFCNKIKF